MLRLGDTPTFLRMSECRPGLRGGVKTPGNAGSGHKEDSMPPETLVSRSLLHAPCSALIPQLLVTFYLRTRHSTGETRVMLIPSLLVTFYLSPATARAFPVKKAQSKA